MAPLFSAVPLYQDYYQVGQDEPSTSRVSGLLSSSCLPSPSSHQWCSGARAPLLGSPQTGSSSPHHPVQRVSLCSCWRDLDEVKESGLLSTMTTREIRLQEVWLFLSTFAIVQA